MPGALLAGDAAGTLNFAKIKGIHQAIRCGMLAAEHLHVTGGTRGFRCALACIRRRTGAAQGAQHQTGFQARLWWGLANAAFETATAGLAPWTLANRSNRELLKLDEYDSPEREWRPRTLPPRDRTASVFFASTQHNEAQPAHLHVTDTMLCATRCASEYGNPCTRFCPAGVYEMIADGAGGKRLQVNAANCVHCKACDLKDPYAAITWTVPEGGSGPNYSNL